MEDPLIHQLSLPLYAFKSDHCPHLHLHSFLLHFSLFAVNVSRLVFNQFVKTDQDTTPSALFFCFYTVFHCFFFVLLLLLLYFILLLLFLFLAACAARVKLFSKIYDEIVSNFLISSHVAYNLTVPPLPLPLNWTRLVRL